jgi:hypothetical protein
VKKSNIPPKPTTTAEQVFAAQLRSWNGPTPDDIQEILRRMCRSLSDRQGNVLVNFLFVDSYKNRVQIHRHFMKLLWDELFAQHEYQHRHQGEQGPPTGKYVGVKGPSS